MGEAIELLKAVFSLGLMFLVGFVAGFTTSIFVWFIYKLLPKLDTFLSLASSYHEFRVSENKRSLIFVLFILVLSMLLAGSFFLVLVSVLG